MSGLPRGTVTLLFTDIEGSTGLLKKLGEGYVAVLAEHERILRKTTEEQGGREVDNQGDSFFFAFERANSALGAAVLAQRALSEHPWPEGGDVRVRMGLHTGEPIVGEERYVGVGVHRAARIGAVAHGGQVLLSSATRELIEDGLAGVSFRDLGSYRLKDLDRAERLYQLDVAGLTSDFPPLKAERVADPLAVSPVEVQIGAEFLGYRIEELIGQGGMGVVYRAYDLRLKRTVALKLVTPELALEERFRERFARETELAMSLEHPNVVPIHDAGEVAGRLYLAMRLVTGTDLRELLREEGALEPSRALSICRQVANALDAAHGRALVHRDVKPSNVLLDENEHVYLTDFGLTRRLEEQGAQAGEGRSIGTPAYLAPEQIEGKAVDGRADVYSLGCLLFECLTGEVPYRPGSRLALAWAHLEEDPPSASERESKLPQSIDGVIRTALAKQPEERYSTCGALIDATASALGLEQLSLPRRRMLLLSAAGTVLVLLAAALTVMAVRGAHDTNVSVPPVRPDTLVRIDPSSNAISDVIGVGSRPSASAIGGRSVWVYNHGASTVAEIDADSDEVRQMVRVSAVPPSPGLLTGPVLDADQRGVWLVGVDRTGAGFLTRILSARHGSREYRLEVEPVAIAIGEGAVWVLGRGGRGDELLRVDLETGEVTGRTRFPPSVQLDSLTVGLGGVWVVGSWSGMLYRVDPRAGRVTGHVYVGRRAGRPGVRFGNIWIGESTDTVIVDPRTLHILATLACCAVEEASTTSAYESTWGANWPTGEVVRWDAATKQPIATVKVTGSPYWGGPCMTSIAAGAGAVWVTVASSVAYSCSV
jgi:serine/threonine protein kinase/class 3 adenylate cyclase